MKPLALLILAFTLVASACGTTGKAKRPPQRVVPFAFNVSTERNTDLNFVNLDYYRFKVLDRLENFQSVDFQLVEPDETPEIILNLKIDNFILLPRDERVSRRVLSRVVQVGTGAAGKPVYQTVRATVDIVQVKQRSNARMLVDLQVKGSPGKTYKQSFAPRYNYAVTYVDNIQGDSRAVDPSLYFARSPGVEPDTMDFLLNLSEEMLDRVSNEIRSYYRK